MWDNTDRKTVARTANHIIRENQALRRDWPDVMPPGFIAIADNDGGDMLVLGPDRMTCCTGTTRPASSLT